MNRNPTPRAPSDGDTGFRARDLPLVLLLGLPLLLASVACEPEPSLAQDIGSGEILADARFPREATSSQRFGFTIPTGAESQGGIAASQGKDYLYETPEGWQELPPSQFRAINFQVGGENGAQCYLTVLGGDGGGLAANVNRWRKQMQLPPLDAEALAALPRGQLLGAPATVFDASGTFAGMGGEDHAEGSRMIGLLAFTTTQSLFFKMVGPLSVVNAEESAFHALAASLRDGHTGHDHGASAPGPLTAQSGAASQTAPSSGTAAAAPTTGGGLSWTVPPGWAVTGPRPMRVVNFDLGGSGDNQCYISILGGNGGGSMANINRWRQQMGQPALSADEFSRLERIPMLDGSALKVEIQGAFAGMGSDDVEEAMLLGVIRELPDRTVFVKMIGQVDALASQRSAFDAFCHSIRFAAGG